MPTPPVVEKTVSVHRAFSYSACAPGAGDIYAGFRARGYSILIVFCGICGWLLWRLIVFVAAAAEEMFGAINGAVGQAMPHIPVVSLGIALAAMILIWYAGMFSAVDAAMHRRRRDRRPAQTSTAWALAMSWLCPGTGQIYTGRLDLGLYLFMGFMAGHFLMVPAYRHLFNGLSEIVSVGQVDVTHLQETIGALHILLRKVDFSVGTLLRHAIKWYAMADTMEALHRAQPASDTRWATRSAGYGLALVGIGWLCPGAGQLLQGRGRRGRLFLVAYIGTVLLIGLAAGREIISVAAADHLEWLSIIIQWAAALEAPLAMKRPAGPLSSMKQINLQ